MDQQISIIGAGSAGLRLARRLAEKNFPVTVFEDHAEIGIPEHCSGLISARNTSELGFDLKDSFTNNIYGAKIYSPNNTQLRIESKKPVAYVMDRSKFDKTLYQQAKKAGADIQLSTSVINVRGNTVFTQSKGRGGAKKTDIIVAADGVNSRFRKMAGFESKPTDFVHSYQVRAAGKFDPRFVELYFGENIAPDFFAWVIPENEESAKIGLGCRMGVNPAHAFKKFLKEKQIDVHIKSDNSFLIPCSPPIRKLYSENMLLLGDAAYQTKATSVDYEEPILVEEDGLLKNVRIGELINRELARTTKKEIILGNNPITIGLPENPIKAFSPSPDASNPALRKIQSVLKHPIDEELYEIILEKGYRVRVTASHSVMVADEDKFVGKKVSDLKIGVDHLPVTLSVPKPTVLHSIDLVPLITKHLKAKELIQKIKIKGQRHLIYSKRAEIDKHKRSSYWENNSIPLFEFVSRNIVLADVSLFHENSDIHVKSHLPITPELCRLLGYYVAEGGCSGKKKITLSFGKNDMENGITDDAISCISTVFNVPVLRSLKHNPETGEVNGMSMEFGGMLLANIFSELLGMGAGASIKEVPFLLFNVGEELKLEFLKGYLRGDGTIRIRKGLNRKNWSAEISCKTVSKKLTSDLILLSLQLDLFPSVEEYRSPTRELYGKKIVESHGYKISFSGKNDLQKLVSIFPAMENELSGFLDLIAEREKIAIPKYLIQDTDSQRYDDPIYAEFGSGISVYKTIALSRVGKAFQQLTQKNSRHVFIENLARSKIALLKIKTIRPVKPTNGEVFDVEIPETQMFVGGMGPILLHNTGGGIIMNCKSADILSTVIHDHIHHEAPLSEYEKRMEPIFQELELHYKIHLYQTRLSDEKIDKLFLKLKDAGMEQFLSHEGDMDEPSRFVNKMIAHPGMLSLIPEAVKFALTK